MDEATPAELTAVIPEPTIAPIVRNEVIPMTGYYGGAPSYPEQMLRPPTHVSIQRVEGDQSISNSWDCLNGSPFKAGSARLRVSDWGSGQTLATGPNTPIPVGVKATLSVDLPLTGFEPGAYNLTLTMEDSNGAFIEEREQLLELLHAPVSPEDGDQLPVVDDVLPKTVDVPDSVKPEEEH